MNHPRKIKVAIDGPAGAGKSTVAKLTAERLDYVYVDTGAMYRAVTWFVLEQKLTPDNCHDIGLLLESMNLTLKSSADGQQVWVNGQDATSKIRSALVTQSVSRIAQIPQVRQFLTDIQKRLSDEGGIVMDGRDIGTEVIPDAELKIFLTASVEERARRRFLELQSAGIPVPMNKLMQDISNRDRMDEQREVSPLRQAPDAVYLDSTALSIHQVVDRIVDLSYLIINKAEV